MKLVKRILSLAFALGMGLGAAGCDEYHYYDVRVSFDVATFPSTLVSEVQFCKVTVSGADSTSFRISNCPPTNSVREVGVFTYSSFADSGNLTFKLDAYTSQMERPDCITGTGTTTVKVGQSSPMGGTPLVVTMANPSCAHITPQQ
jgi:hypothetical protein